MEINVASGKHAEYNGKRLFSCLCLMSLVGWGNSQEDHSRFLDWISRIYSCLMHPSALPYRSLESESGHDYNAKFDCPHSNLFPLQDLFFKSFLQTLNISWRLGRKDCIQVYNWDYCGKIKRHLFMELLARKSYISSSSSLLSILKE